MARNRRTVSLKPEVNEVLEDKRGKKNLSTYLNDHFEDEFPKDVSKKRKELEDLNEKTKNIKKSKIHM